MLLRMGLNPGKNNRKLPDMSEEALQEYKRHPDAELIVDNKVPLGQDGTILSQCEWGRHQLIVDFSYNQYLEDSHPDRKGAKTPDVARIDCCHSEIHKHQFYKAGGQNRDIIQDLRYSGSIEEVEKVVNLHSMDCYNQMVDGWQSYLDLWKEA